MSPGMVQQGSLMKGHILLTYQVILQWIVNDDMVNGLFVSAAVVMAH